MEVLRRQLCFSRESSVDMGSDHSQRGGSFPLDMNMYATRKTLAQGMLDLALLSANACQLRRALSVPPGQRFFGASVAFLGLSIALQLLAGFLLVLLGRWNINCPWEQRRADTLNNVVVLLAFLISVVNVLLSAFSPDIQPPEDPHKVYRPQNGWFDAPQ